jgi:hypothetical protein
MGGPSPVAWNANPPFRPDAFVMTDPVYPAPHRLTVDDLDPETATTDTLIALVHQHRQGQEYPTAAVLLDNLPMVLRALCDHVLTGQATAFDVAHRLASVIEALEGRETPLAPSRRTH